MTTEEQYQNLSHNIRVLRKTHGLSRTAMARRLHVTTRTLDSLEAGVIPDRVGVLLLYYLQYHFHIPISKLFMTRLE